MPNFLQYPSQQQSFSKQIPNPNKTIAWSSINSNYQDSISPLNYKVSNPSSSLIMSSLSHIQEDDAQTTGSTMTHQNHCHNFKPNSKHHHAHRRKDSSNTTEKQFYQYLITQNQIKAHQNHHPITFDHDYTIPSSKSNNFTLMNYHSNCSAEESLVHLEQSQEELSFLKFKLKEAYEKLEKEILNSYHLQEKIQHMRAELQGKDQMIELQKTQNEKLKFTLKAIMKNKSFLEEEIQNGEQKKTLNNQNDREHQLKENLKLKLEIKDFEKKLKFCQEKIESLTAQNQKLTQDLSQRNQQLQSLKSQLSKKDQYLQTLSQQLHCLDSLKTQNKNLLLRQAQYLDQINVIELELRKVTNEKVTSVSRLKHELAMVQKQNQELLHQNQALQHYQTQSNAEQNHFVPYQPVTSPQTHFKPYSPSPSSKGNLQKSCHKYSNTNTSRMINQIPIQPPMIFDSEDEDSRKISERFVESNNQHGNSSLINLNNSDSLNMSSMNANRKRNMSYEENKENVSNLNMQSSFVDQLNDRQQGKSVGKWKKANSQSNNSSLYIESQSTEQFSIRQPNRQSQTMLGQQPEQTTSRIQSLETNKVSLRTAFPETEDQKLSKYQQHRKKIETQLSSLQKIKRPTPEERQKIQKLQKQLYYLDSDIAGLKRKIRRKY